MLKLLFTILFNLFWLTSLCSQDIHQIKEYADVQFAKGNNSIALKEYQRILLFDQDKQFNRLYEQIASIYYDQEAYSDAEVYYDFAWKASQNDSIKLELSFKKALCYLKDSRYLLAITELLDFPDGLSPYFENKLNLYFAICYYGLDDDEQSLLYFTQVVDSVGMELGKVSFSELAKHRKKYNPDRLEMMSIFLPGLGQTVAGDFKSGLNSVLLLGGLTVYSYYTAVTYGLLDGTLMLVTWVYRYYTGGHKKAFNLGSEKIRDKKNTTYLQILETVNNHPVN